MSLCVFLRIDPRPFPAGMHLIHPDRKPRFPLLNYSKYKRVEEPCQQTQSNALLFDSRSDILALIGVFGRNKNPFLTCFTLPDECLGEIIRAARASPPRIPQDKSKINPKQAEGVEWTLRTSYPWSADWACFCSV